MDASGFDLGGGGRTTGSIGAASDAACDEVRRKILAIASEMLQTQAQALFGPVAGSGAFTKPGVPVMAGCAMGHFIDSIDIPVFAVYECEVAVDPDTGHVEILD